MGLTSLSLGDDVKKALDDMRTAYKAVKSATLKLQLTVPEDSDDPGSVLKFDYNFSSPDKERATFFVPGDSDGFTVISEGDKVLWSSKPMDDDKDSDDKDDADADDPEGTGFPTQFFSDPDAFLMTADGEFGGTDLDVHDEKWNDKEWTVIQETFSKDQTIRRFYIDPKTHLVWRVTDSDTADDKIQSDFQVMSLEINPKLDDTLFEPPK